MSAPTADRLTVRTYRACIALLPAGYRGEYGEAMLETFARRAAAAGGPLARARLLARELAGLLRVAWGEQRARRPRPDRRGAARAALLGAWARDLRHAARRLLRSPGFTVATVLTLAVAAGGNAAIFSVVHAILLAPLPYPDASRLVAVRSAVPRAGADDIEMTIGLFLHYRSEVEAFRSIALYERAYRNLTSAGEPARLETIRVTEDFFATLGVEPQLGRVLGPADTTADAPAVVVLSHALWSSRYGSDAAILGRTIVLDDLPHTVVGVMPRDFDFPRAGTDAWTAWWIDRERLSLMSFSYDAVARLAQGSTEADANAQIARAIASYPEAFGREQAEWERMGLQGFVRDLKEHTVGNVGATLWLFAGAGAFVMLLACANVANLFLVRSESRSAEARIRSALGASRAQLLRYWTAESVCLALLSLLVGLGIAGLSLGAIVDLAADLPRIRSVHIGGATIVFTACLTAAAALVFGAVPLLAGRAAGSRPAAARGATGGTRERRRREVLVAVQVALALTLTVGAALMLQSVHHLTHADPGFDPQGVLTFRITLPDSTYTNREAAARFHGRLVETLAALPGARAAGVARCMPLQGWCGGNPVSSPDSPLPPEGFRQVVSVKPISAGYLEAVRVPLLAGRTLEPADTSQRSGAALLSESLAARLFPGATPAEVLGKRVYPQDDLETDVWFTVVGVVGSIQRTRIDEPPAEILYVPLLGVAGDRHLAPIHDIAVALRVDGDPLAALDAARSAVHDLDRNVPLASIRTLADIHADATARNRFTAVLLSLAAGAGLLLGAVGIYGVVSWGTRQRTAEFGVRAALGARRVDLLAMVMTRGLAVIVIGALVGVGASLATTRLLTAMLYRVGASDPATFGAVLLLLVLVGAVATWLPARRAARIDPVEALRSR